MTKKSIDKEEEKIIFSYEKGEWESDKNLSKRKGDLQTMFKNTVSNKKAISIRLLETDIEKIKSKAIEEWIPYQTLISSILHKYTTGKLS